MFRALSIVAVLLLGLPASAAELVMVQREGCVWCAKWNREIAPIYPKTAESAVAPLRRVDLADIPGEMTLVGPVFFTPTFLLVEDGHELARIEGYPGPDFFWGLLDVMLTEHTEFKGNS